LEQRLLDGLLLEGFEVSTTDITRANVSRLDEVFELSAEKFADDFVIGDRASF